MPFSDEGTNVAQKFASYNGVFRAAVISSIRLLRGRPPLFPITLSMSVFCDNTVCSSHVVWLVSGCSVVLVDIFCVVLILQSVS